jgi:hypothetical protein
MEVEVNAEAKDRLLNRQVAITVVVLSVFMGLAQVKDGNIVQAMDLAQSNAVDRWDEYQATRIKAHVDEAALAEISALGKPQLAAEEQRLKSEIDKYDTEAPRLRREAQGLTDRYNALNIHDDQFDASDALIAIAISISAVTALTEHPRLMWVAWAFGAGGLVMGLAGFLGLNLHLELLSSLLG